MDRKGALFALLVVLVVLAYVLTQQKGPLKNPGGQWQCLAWHNGDGRYVPLQRPCDSAADCPGHVEYVGQEMNPPDIEGLFRNYDFSKVRCSQYGFEIAFGPGGGPVSCSTSEDCIKKTAMYTYVRDGKVADRGFDFIRKLGFFRCGDSVCEITSLMHENEEACVANGGEYQGCSYFISN